MAQTDIKKLDSGDEFPTLSLKLADGSHFTLPDDLSHEFTVFLGYSSGSIGRYTAADCLRVVS